MNKNSNKTPVVKKKKSPEIDINRQLAPELKDKAIELFTKQSDELAKEEANKRKASQKQKSIFVNRIGEEVNVDDYVAKTYAGKSTHFFPIFYNLIADCKFRSC